MKEYVIIYGFMNEKEHYFKERNRENVSKSTYYRRKRVWKKPPIGVTIHENKSWNAKILFVGFDD